MGDNQKRIKVTVEATGNEFTLNTSELIAKTRDVLLDRRRSDIAATTWGVMSENDQKDELHRYTEFAEDLVHGIVEVVASGNFDVIHAKLDNFKSKDGEVTVTAKGRSSDGALLALNRIGHKHLKIIVADQDQFDEHRDVVPIDADQPEMFGDDPDQTDAPESDENGEIVDPDTGEILQDDGGPQEPDVEPELSDEETAAALQERLKNAHAFGRGSYDEHQDPDQNPYFEDEDDQLRVAWFNGFYERKNEVEPSIADREERHSNEGAQTEADKNPVDHGDSTTDAAEAVPDSYQAGMDHRQDDGARDENPYDGGTDEHSDWQQGFDQADREIAELFNAGYEAAEAGKTEGDSGWKKGTFEHERWMFGFNHWHQKNPSEE